MLIFVSLLIVSFETISGELYKVYEENPFLNGEFQPGVNLPQGPVNDPYETPHSISTSPPIIVNPIRPKPTTQPPPPPPINDLSKYCLHPRGQFPSRYCNAFVNCWEGNVVEQFCGKTLVFNPKGYCDYAFNVNCHGKPIKEIHVGPSDGSYRPTITPPVNDGPIYTIEPPGFPNEPPPSSTGWPINGIYRPPVTAGPPGPPYKPTVKPPGIPHVPVGPTGWPIDGSYRPPVTAGPPGPPYKPTVKPPGIPHVPLGPTGWPIDGSYRPPVPAGPSGPPYIPTRPPIFTIEPPGFPGAIQDPITPPHDHTIVPKPTTSTTTPAPPPTGSNLHKYCLRARGQFAGPHCHKFVNCWDDVAIEQDCPDGLHFNPLRGYCDFPFNYPCRKFKDGNELTNDEAFEYSSHVGNDLGV